MLQYSWQINSNLKFYLLGMLCLLKICYIYLQERVIIMNKIKIGNYIQLKRKEKKLTQEQLAEKLCVSNKTISKWECGKALPDYLIS